MFTVINQNKIIQDSYLQTLCYQDHKSIWACARTVALARMADEIAITKHTTQHQSGLNIFVTQPWQLARYRIM
jgi:hypothetical protein